MADANGYSTTGSPLLLLRVDAGHQQTEPFGRGLLARQDIHDAALVDDGDAVGEGQDLVQVL